MACVLSSLGNVALNFEDVYPSPFLKRPSTDHIELAQYIAKHHRGHFFVGEDVLFDDKSFVFKGSVKGNVFEKSEHDQRFYHRNQNLTHYYLKRLNFEHGDELMQIGKVGLSTFPKYFFSFATKKLKLKQVSSPSETPAF